MSYQSTLGFAPIVRCNTPWITPKGKQLYVSMVNLKLREYEPDASPVELNPYLESILVKSVVPNDSSTLESPSDSVKDAVKYAAIALANQFRMDRRLETMRNSSCASALQPRGVDDTDRRLDLSGREPINSGGVYAKYMANQTRLKMRFQ